MSALIRTPIARYVVVSSLLIAVVALVPGMPFYAEDGVGTLGGAVLIEVFVVAGLVLGSRVAWYVATFIAVGGVAFSCVAVLNSGGVGPKSYVVLLLYAVLALVLFSGEFENADRRRQTAT